MISKTSFIGQFIDDITEYYEFVKELGSGTYGKVYRVQNKITKDIRACKKISKKKIKNKERLKIEIDLMKATDHPNIVKLFEIYEDQQNLYMIMEECVGGEFFERIANRAKEMNFYTEKEAASLFKQIMSAVNYCHCHGVSHRDLKPENLLFSVKCEDSPIKLIDFGLSKIFANQDNKMRSVVGTTYYMAPEVATGSYDERCDIWSCGVILYIMLCGRPPFHGKNDDEIIKKAKTLSYHFNYPEWSKVSEDVKDLISKIFVDAKNRLTSQEVLEHNWVKHNAPNSTEECLKLEFDNILHYMNMNKIKKSVISFITFRLKDEETLELKDIFQSLDQNQDGVLTMEEIREGLKTLRAKKPNMVKTAEEDLEKLFDEIDLDKNGLINYSEFVSASVNHKKILRTDSIRDAFRSFDTDQNGKISLQEICDVIKPQTDEDVNYMQELMSKYDKNNDGELDIDEFMETLEFDPNKDYD